MSCGVLEVHEDRIRPCGLDPDEFARSIRRFALDAHDVLSRSDSRPGDLIWLHRRVFHLIEGAPVAQADGILTWLLAVRQRIGARLQSWSLEALEARVA